MSTFLCLSWLISTFSFLLWTTSRIIRLWLKYLFAKLHVKFCTTKALKGVCHKISDLQFFSWSEPIWPLINRLKYFRIRFQFCWDIRSQRWSPQCATYRRDHLHGVQHTAEIISTVCITPRRWPQCTPQRRSHRCATYHGDILHTAESK